MTFITLANEKGNKMTPKQRFPNWKMPIIEHGKPTNYGWTVLYPQNLILGKYTDIASLVLINSRYGVEIGEGTQIGPFTAILSDNSINQTHGKIKIGKNVRIGSHVLILPNTIIQDNVFIKSHSIIK